MQSKSSEKGRSDSDRPLIFERFQSAFKHLEKSLPTALINGVDLYYEVHGAGPTVVAVARRRQQSSALVAAGAGVVRKHFQVITLRSPRDFGFLER